MKSATNQKGVIHTLPLLIIVAAVGVISFLLISSTFPLNGLFGVINPKPDSHAAGPVGVWTNVTPSNMDASYRTIPGCSDSFGATPIVSDPARPSNIYVKSDCYGIWKSTDYGQTWTYPVNTGANASAITNSVGGVSIAAGAAGQPPTLYYGSIRGENIGLWKSTDGGVNWTKVTSSTFIRDDLGPPAVDPFDSNHLVLAPHELNVLYQSFDGGASWTLVNLLSTMKTGCDGSPLPGSGGFAFVNTGSASTTRNTWLWLAQATGGCVGTWRTTDGGTNWNKVDNNEKPHGGFQTYQPGNGIIFAPGIYSALGWGVLRSTDYGQTWTHVGNTGQASVVWGTPNRVYSGYSFACGGCTLDPNLQSGPQPAITGWTNTTAPAGMGIGPANEVTVFDGTNYVFITANWWAGVWRYVEPASGATPTPSATAAPSPTPAPSAAPTTSYNSSFPLTENPISEGGRWLNGATNGLDWTDVSTVPGKIFGNQSPSTPKYKDPVAILTGSWAPDQQAQGTVFCNNPNASFFQEVELHLRFSLTAHNAAGYEIFSRCQKNPSGYFSIVRWNGPAANFTELLHLDGTQYGVQSGDVLKATAIGNVITGYINGVQVGQVTDSTYPTGNPGVGFNYGVGTTNTDFGFTNFSASAIGSTPAPSASPQPTATPTGKVGDLDNDGDVDIFDYSTLVTNFGRTGTNIVGDLDHDGDVDIFDYSALVTNFGK